VTRRHIKSVRILNTVDHIQYGTGGTDVIDFKEYLENKLVLGMVILKCILKKLLLFLDFILHYHTAQNGNLRIVNEVI
jgi:hypothetical protein